jgi:hypothetical protein
LKRLLVLSFLVLPAIAGAQSNLKVALSGRGTSEVSLNVPTVEGKPAPKPLLIKVDFGQPHARGREVPVELTKIDTIWRTGANVATSLTTDLDLVVGGTTVPKGSYSLYTVHTAAGYLLIINKKTGQSGAEYDRKSDFASVPLKARTLGETHESFQVALIPAGDQSPKGVLAITWGKLELSTNWSVK